MFLAASDSGSNTHRGLSVVQNGMLHYLPFKALMEDSRKVLIEKYTMRALPSASVMKFQNQEMASSEKLLVLGNPHYDDPLLDLPEAVGEAKAISTLWPDSKVIM